MPISSLPMFGATLSRSRRTLLFAAPLATAAVFATAEARPAEPTARSQSLADLRALGVTPEFAASVGPSFVARARSRGVNTIVLNRHLSGRQKRRVRFTGDFETGNVSQWNWGAQCANTGVPSRPTGVRGTIAVQSEIVAQGKYGARVDLPAATVYTACETLTRRPIGSGTHDYYGMMVRFPSGWQEPSPANWGLVIAQLNFQNIWGSPVSLSAHADRVELVLTSGLCKNVYTSKPGCAYSSARAGNVKPMLAVPAPLALEVWHQLIVHVRWTTDSSGVLEVWHRLQRSNTWNKTVSRRGYPTLQWTRARGRRAIASGTTVDKIGAYRGHSTFPLSVWHDGFVRAGSFAATASALRW